MKRLVPMFLLSSTILIGGMAGAAVAAKPVREPVELPGSIPVNANVCGFPVVLEVLVNRTKTTTFSDGRSITTGTLRFRVVNEQSGKSIDVNASGPTFATPGPNGTTTTTYRGAALIGLGPTEPEGPGLFLYKGPTVITTDATGHALTVTHQGATRFDICAAVSG